MATLTYSRTTALPRSLLPRALAARRPGVRPLRSPAFGSLLTPLLASGLLTALLVPALQLSMLGPIDNFASLWLENWLVAWAIMTPVIYLMGPTLAKLGTFVSTPSQAADEGVAGLAFSDIAAASARATDRHGFTVLRNLKVREDFYRA